MENFTFVVGFDLGHGETALTMVNLKSEHKKDPAVKIKVKGESNFITAIAYHPQKGILIGEPAITTEGVTESHLAFKQRPNTDSTYQKILADYVRYIFQEVKAASYGITDTNTLFVIGCPTDWATEKNRHLVSTYETIFHNGAKISHVKVVAESRGALMNAIESGDINIIGELRGRALVIDLGSSTADFTMINLAQRHADPFDFGHDLGASLIDKLIFRHFLYQHKRKNDIIPLITSSSVHRNRCELACRKAKESWFKANDSVAAVFVDIIPDELEFRGRVTKELMQTILGSSFEELRDMEPVYGKSFAFLPKKSWEEELKALLKQALVASEKLGKLPDIVLLTGGASEMSFVKPACQSIFPKSEIKRGPEPEYAISRGLAYWGRVDVRTQGFVESVKNIVEQNLPKRIDDQISHLFSGLAETLTDDVIKTVVLPVIAKWRDTSDSASTLKQQIKTASERWGKSEEVKQKVNHALSDYLATVAESLNQSDLKQVALKYGIPDQNDALNVSKEIRNIFQHHVDVNGKIPDVIDIDDFNLAVKKAQDEVVDNITMWIVGIVIGVLMFFGIGIILGIIIAVASFFIGKEAAKDMVDNASIYSGVKKRIDFEGKLREKRPEIITEIRTQLGNNEELKRSIQNNGREVIEGAIMKKVESARVFID